MKILLVILVVILIAGLQMFIKNSVTPKNLGVENDMLAPVPKSPNAVSSQSTLDDYYVEPLPMKADVLLTKIALLRAVEIYGNSEVIIEEDHYIHIVFTTPRMKFRDDLELYIDEVLGVVHYRSASRVGYSDMGLNRQRYDDIVKLYEGIN